jgi:hypothetical protein
MKQATLFVKIFFTIFQFITIQQFFVRPAYTKKTS